MNKYQARKRRSLRTKAVIRNGDRPWIVVRRTGMHMYAQIVIAGPSGDLVLVSSSTIDKELKSKLDGKKAEQAFQVGKLLALRAQEQKIVDVAFDRSGYKYHGRVEALAKGAREHGLNF